MTPRVVFDCMVFLQGVGRPAGPARACIQLVDHSRITLILSAEILTELRDVLTRQKTLRKFPLLTLERVEAFLRAAETNSVVIADVPHSESLERDPKDEPYLNLAIATKAEYLVTRDRDLLDLMDDSSFQQRYPDLRILDPVEFLNEIRRIYPTGNGDEGQATAHDTESPDGT